MEQPVAVMVAVRIIRLPFGMPVMLKLVPLPDTVPSVDRMVFALDVRLTE